MGETFAKWDAADSLKTEEDAMFYLEACIDEDEGDGRLILVGLSAIARKRNMSRLAREAGISRDALYKTLSEGKRPGFSIVLRIIRALGFELMLRRRAEVEEKEAVSA